MNRGAVQAWVDALRSGKYKQTQGTLCRLDENGDVTGYCCLGVACEIYSQTHNDLNIESFGDYRTYDTYDSNLPEIVYDWLAVNSYLSEEELIEMNDLLNNTFGDIADCIEDRYLKKEVK